MLLMSMRFSISSLRMLRRERLAGAVTAADATEGAVTEKGVPGSGIPEGFSGSYSDMLGKGIADAGPRFVAAGAGVASGPEGALSFPTASVGGGSNVPTPSSVGVGSVAPPSRDSTAPMIPGTKK
jgi:hypothetical protein